MPSPSPSFSSIGSQDDHPADANYYFSSGEQGRCYLAPERFYSAPQASEGASAAGGAGGAGAAATGAPRAAGGAGAGLAGARGAGLDGLVGAYFWTKGRCDRWMLRLTVSRVAKHIRRTTPCFFRCRR